MFVSFDPDLKTNPNAIPFKLPEGNLLFDADEYQEQCFSLQTEGETADRLQSALQVLSAEKYEDYIRIYRDIASSIVYQDKVVIPIFYGLNPFGVSNKVLNWQPNTSWQQLLVKAKIK